MTECHTRSPFTASGRGSPALSPDRQGETLAAESSPDPLASRRQGRMAAEIGGGMLQGLGAMPADANSPADGELIPGRPEYPHADSCCERRAGWKPRSTNVR